jgi:hypothetical protein
MLHPGTELRFINSLIGYGVFAVRDIPKGTVTWARDELDQTFTPARLHRFSPFHRALLDRYAFVDRRGDSILCWDHARYINHSCEASCLSPGYGFEVAVRDIPAGEELTDDYGSLNLDGPFTCHCGLPGCRKEILPDDLLRYGALWDGRIAAAFRFLTVVEQPLWELVPEKDEIARVLAGKAPIASCRENYCGPPLRRVSGG